MRRHALLLTLLVLVTGSILARAGNSGSDWIYFESMETGSGPRLEVVGEDGKRRRFGAAKDNVLIRYLADRAWGRLPQLSVDLGDRNRVLIAWSLPDGLAVKQAELVLAQKLSRTPPSESFEMSVHRVAAEWSDATSWNTRPAFDGMPIAKVTVEPKPGVLRIDLTEAVKAGLPYGVLLKVALPIEVVAAPVRPARSPLQGALAFEKSPQRALARAVEEGKLVLTLVRGAFRNDPRLTFAEETLLASALLHPDITKLIESRFVPLRMAYTPWLYTFGKRDPRDPLPVIGTSAPQTKAPALVVSTGEGTHVASLESIGTYDPWLVFAFLSRALKQAGDKVASTRPDELLAAGQLDAALGAARRISSVNGPYWTARALGLGGDPEGALRQLALVAGRGAMLENEIEVETGIARMRLGSFAEAQASLARASRVEGTRKDEALYYLGCLVYRGGGHDRARKLWQRVPDASPWNRKAQARLRWPERMDMFECLEAPRPGPELTSTEAGRDRATAIPRALAYLAAQQQPDGSWVNPIRYRTTEAAITALCAWALFEYGSHAAAVERATTWLRDYLEREDPADANGWSAAYTLDYFLARLGKDKAFGKDAQRAVEFVLGGQCPNGAWSYNRNWGVRWKGGFGGWPKTDEGRFHSMNTGPSLVALLAARDSGLKVDPAALERGRKVLLEMREAPGVWTYTYPVPRSFNEEPRHSIGRAPTCELALFKLGAAPREDLAKTMKYFMEFRAGLRRSVKLSASWMPPQAASAYFYHFAYHHAAVALDVLGDTKARAALRRDLLEVAEADGTWVDHDQSGKPYATAMALLVLRETP